MKFSKTVAYKARKSMKMRVASTVAGLLALCLSMTLGSVAQAQLTPLSFSSVVAGLAPGTTAAVCAGALNTIGDGCPATQAQIATIYETWTDQYSNVYFVDDTTSHELRVVYRGGATLASVITLNNPTVTTPQIGYVYAIAGSYTRTTPYSSTSIGKYCNGGTSGPVITDQGGGGCPGFEAYTAPTGGFVDADGNIFLADHINGGMIRVIYMGGAKAAALISVESGGTITSPVIGTLYRIVSTTAGTQGFGGDGALATTAYMRNPYEVIVDGSENVYFTDNGNNAVRKVDGTSGIINTIAGAVCTVGTVSPYGCTAGLSANGTAANASEISGPYSIALDANGNLYITDTVNSLVRAIFQSGTLPGITNPTVGAIYTIAGGGTATASGVPATTLHLYAPHTVSFDPSGNLYVGSASTSTTIYEIDPTTGTATLFSGGGGTTTVGGYCSGTTGPMATDTVGSGCAATQSKIWPTGRLSFDPNGVAYIADTSSSVVRALTFHDHFPATAVGSSSIFPVAVTSASSFVAPVITASVQGSATAEFSATSIKCTAGATYPAATVCSYNVQFSPTLPGRRTGEFAMAQSGTTVLTQGIEGDGVAALLAITPEAVTTFGSTIAKVSSVSVDALGNLYASDSSTGTLWKLAGTAGTPTALITGLTQPAQSAIDGQGNVFVADTGNNRIVERTASGTTVNLLSGVLSGPQGVAVLGNGTLYIADTGNNRVLRYAKGVQSQLPLSGLSAPGALALDANDNLFVADTGNQQVVTFSGGLQNALSFSSVKVNASGLAVDAAGNLYAADKLTNSVLRLTAGSATGTVLASGLTSPSGISIDSNGDVFYADSSVAGLSEAIQQNGMIAFPNTNQGDSSATTTVSVADIGNADLTFTSSPGYVGTGNTADFSISAGSSGCGTGTVVSGSLCTLGVIFSPQSTNSYTEAVTFQTNAVNSSTVVLHLSGQGVNLIHTSTAVTYSPLNPVYGDTVSFTVTVTALSGTAVPSGNVTLTIDGISSPNLTLTNGTVTFSSSTLSAGTHAVVAAYQGSASFLPSNGSLSFTVAQQPTKTMLTYSFSASTSTLSLTAHVTPASGTSVPSGNVVFTIDGVASPNQALMNGTVTFTSAALSAGVHAVSAMYLGNINYSSSSDSFSYTVVLQPTTTTLSYSFSASTSTLSLTAHVTPSISGQPTGIVNFLGGGTVIGSASLLNGVATYTTQNLSYAAYSAQYLGDVVFAASTSASVSPPATFGMTQATQTLTTVAGLPITTTFTPISYFGYNGKLTFACSGLPVNTVCRFQPTTVSLASGTSSVVTLQVFTNVSPGAQTSGISGNGYGFWLMLLSVLTSLMMFRKRFRVRQRFDVWLLPLLLTLPLLAAITGCQGGVTNFDPTATPVGVSTFTLTASDGAGNSQAVTYTLVVTK